MKEATDKKSNAIPGFHGVREALIHGTPLLRELWIATGRKSERRKEILDMAGSRNVPVRFAAMAEFEKHFPGVVHQGIVGVSAPFSYRDLTEIAAQAKRNPGTGLILGADHITDEGNLGALIRVGSFFAADGLIIPKDRSAQVTPRVIKRSSGATGHLAVCRVVNLRRALGDLSAMGFWVVGTAGESTQSIYEFDWNRDLVMVLGNEERGLSSAVRKECHALVSIPRLGPLESLNVSVSAGVMLGEIRRQQQKQGTC
jgi:23S rRNA (guanosine2251-2'-O)-methyltransferase